MKIFHLKQHEIDRKAYDHCIEQSPYGTVYAMSWYLDTVSPGWNLLMSDDYNYVMPLPVKSRYGIEYAIQPNLCQQLGVFSTKPLSLELLNCFVRQIPYTYYDLQLNSGNVFEGQDISLQLNYLLNLNRTYEEIRSEYKKNCLRNVKKAEKGNLTLHHTTDQQVYLNVLFDNFEKRPIRHMRVLFESLLEAFRQHAKVEIWHVKDESQSILSCSIFLYWNSRVYYFVPVSTMEGKQKQSMSFLIDSFIRAHAFSNCILDFEGSSLPDVARYYGGFGAMPEFYPRICKKTIYSKIYALTKKIK